jgi:hypothetical protein
LIVAVAIAHSYLGERYILIRVFRHADLPKLFGNAEFTCRTLRFAWFWSCWPTCPQIPAHLSRRSMYVSGAHSCCADRVAWAQAQRLYHMGFRCSTISRNTLANANATRPWQMYSDLAQHLIGIARPLYASDPFGVDLDATVYAFDPTTIDLCLSVYPWAPFQSTKAALKLHTLLDLRGAQVAQYAPQPRVRFEPVRLGRLQHRVESVRGGTCTRKSAPMLGARKKTRARRAVGSAGQLCLLRLAATDASYAE